MDAVEQTTVKEAAASCKVRSEVAVVVLNPETKCSLGPPAASGANRPAKAKASVHVRGTFA